LTGAVHVRTSSLMELSNSLTKTLPMLDSLVYEKETDIKKTQQKIDTVLNNYTIKTNIAYDNYLNARSELEQAIIDYEEVPEFYYQAVSLAEEEYNRLLTCCEQIKSISANFTQQSNIIKKSLIQEKESYSSVLKKGTNFIEKYIDKINQSINTISRTSSTSNINAGSQFNQNANISNSVSVNTDKAGLNNSERALIKKETGWSNSIIYYIGSMEQYAIYKNAGLREAEINLKKCLIKDIDLGYVDKDTGLKNIELMTIGRRPIDSKTGERIELHHMNQKEDAPFAELTENSEHGDGNHKTLHPKREGSWRNNPTLKNWYNKEKKDHWIRRTGAI